MGETIPTQLTVENETTVTDLELVADQMHDITSVPGIGLSEIDSETPEERCKKLAEWAKSGQLEGALNKAGYYEDEWTDDSNKLLQLGLMTPRFIDIQGRADVGATDLTEELVEHNEVLREAIKANPGLKPDKLAIFMQDAAMWGDLPDAYRKTTENYINRSIHGARAELIFEQILCSDSVKTARISHEATSSEDDRKGADLRVTVPFGSGKEEIRVVMPVDIKASSAQVARLIKPGEMKAHAIHKESVVMWSGVDLRDLNNSLLLDNDAAEEKGALMNKILQAAAVDYYNEVRQGRISGRLGRTATRAA